MKINGQQRILLDSETSNLTNVSDSHFVSIQNQKFQSTMAEKGQAGNSSRSFFRTATLPSKPCFAESDSAWTKYKTFRFLPCFQNQMSFDVWGNASLDRRACVANLKKTKFVSHFFSLNSIASGNYFNSKCLKKHWNLCSYFVFGWDVYRQQEGQKVLCIINVSFPILGPVPSYGPSLWRSLRIEKVLIFRHPRGVTTDHHDTEWEVLIFRHPRVVTTDLLDV